MPIAEINYLAVLVAAIVATAIGAFWYSPMAFGKQWATLMGWQSMNDPAKKKEANRSMAIGFVATLLTAYILAHFVDYVEAVTLGDGVVLGFWVWLGFIATTLLGSVLWEGKPVKLYFINAAYYLISFPVMAAVLAMWQ